MSNEMYICSDQSRGAGKTLWVSHKRGDDGVDWGYSTKQSEALPLTERMAKIYINELGRDGGRQMTPCSARAKAPEPK